MNEQKIVFLCLANSTKHLKRCIAGVELEKYSEGLHKIRQSNNRPKWLRPVSAGKNGAIPIDIADHMRVLDIVEATCIREIPSGHQRENVLVDLKSIKSIRSLGHKEVVLQNKVLSGICESRGDLWGSGKAVSQHQIRNYSHSLCLIRPDDPKPYKSSYNKFRIKFRYGKPKIEYDLPITDPNFNCVTQFGKDAYLTISLAGEKWKGEYYKLVAAVIVPTDRTETAVG